MALELNKLTRQVEAMGIAMAQRRQDELHLMGMACEALATHGEVTDALRQKIQTARTVDQSWRGAEPFGSRMDEHCHPRIPPLHATLIAADGSQIYPNRHGIAIYYLLNTGSMILRQGSGQAPDVETTPQVFYEEGQLYDSARRLRTPEYINRQRDRLEIEALVRLAEEERTRLGGDISRPIITLLDGPLLPWQRPMSNDEEASEEMSRHVEHFIAQLDRLKRTRAIPVGYVDRPGSANVLRTLELAEMPHEAITRPRLRQGKFRSITDRLLFRDLAPGERSSLFVSTSRMNDPYADAGHKMVFFYMNVETQPGPENAVLARLEIPEWVAANETSLDLLQHAVQADCHLTHFPYVLARAHELAVVTTAERADFESMLQQSLLRHGLSTASSNKAILKQLTASKRR